MKRVPTFLCILCIGCACLAQRATFAGFAILQGAWQGSDTMLTTLNQRGLLPFKQPFGSGALQYSGSDSLSAIPTDMVDWILIELRTTPDTVYDRRAAWLNKYGQIMAVDGSPEIRFNAAAGDYFVSIRHPSHLAVMTAFPISLPLPPPGHWDFRNPQQYPAYGNCTILLPSGHAAMISGDLSQDNVLKYSGPFNDRSPVLQRIGQVTGSGIITSTAQGYFPEDLSMDGTLRYSGPGNDPSRIIQNLISLTGSTAITASFTGCAPTPVVLPPPPYVWMCGDPLPDPRDGQIYPTTRISTQCWFSKNLNIGNFRSSDSTALIHTQVSDNDTTEKYCYDNNPSECEARGALYDWNEAMAYDTLEGSRGICPEGWHIPTDVEWMVLEGNADHQYTDAYQPEWQYIGWRGMDAGAMLKQAGAWPSGDVGNPLRFGAVPSGIRHGRGYFAMGQDYVGYWSSTRRSWPDSLIARRLLADVQYQIGRDFRWPEWGYSVRCLQDSVYPCLPVPDQADAGPDRM
ncbi:MAG TPA: FISUMP domain-containing protein, partial [Bacteroidales bacterium]|nr:FISUMP domain-containing protein [Bacteroidales bacterium]